MEKKYRNLAAVVFGIYFIYSIFTDTSPIEGLGRFYYIFWSIFAIFFGLYWGIKSKQFAFKTARAYEKIYTKTKFSFFKRGFDYYQDQDVQSFIRTICFAFVAIGFSLIIKILFLN